MLKKLKFLKKDTVLAFRFYSQYSSKIFLKKYLFYCNVSELYSNFKWSVYYAEQIVV